MNFENMPLAEKEYSENILNDNMDEENMEGGNRKGFKALINNLTDYNKKRLINWFKKTNGLRNRPGEKSEECVSRVLGLSGNELFLHIKGLYNNVSTEFNNNVGPMVLTNKEPEPEPELEVEVVPEKKGIAKGGPEKKAAPKGLFEKFGNKKNENENKKIYKINWALEHILHDLNLEREADKKYQKETSGYTPVSNANELSDSDLELALQLDLDEKNYKQIQSWIANNSYDAKEAKKRGLGYNYHDVEDLSFKYSNIFRNEQGELNKKFRTLNKQGLVNLINHLKIDYNTLLYNFFRSHNRLRYRPTLREIDQQRAKKLEQRRKRSAAAVKGAETRAKNKEQERIKEQERVKEQERIEMEKRRQIAERRENETPEEKAAREQRKLKHAQKKAAKIEKEKEANKRHAERRILEIRRQMTERIENETPEEKAVREQRKLKREQQRLKKSQKAKPKSINNSLSNALGQLLYKQAAGEPFSHVTLVLKPKK